MNGVETLSWRSYRICPCVARRSSAVWRGVLTIRASPPYMGLYNDRVAGQNRLFGPSERGKTAGTTELSTAGLPFLFRRCNSLTD